MSPALSHWYWTFPSTFRVRRVPVDARFTVKQQQQQQHNEWRSFYNARERPQAPDLSIRDELTEMDLLPVWGGRERGGGGGGGVETTSVFHGRIACLKS